MIGRAVKRESEREQVREIVARVKACSPAEIRLDSSLEETFGGDSLDLLHFVFELERGFRVRSQACVSHVTLSELLREAGGSSVVDFASRVIEGRLLS